MNPQEIIADIFDHIRGMWRYRWLAAGVGWAICIVGWFYVLSLPNMYAASAKVFVDTNSLLRPLMQGLTAQRDPLEEVRAVSRALLTRPYLERVAHDTDLTLRVETPEQLEKLITSLQNRIKVTGGRDQIFTIEYQDPSRAKAEEVVAAILDRFVENALGNQGEDTQMTERALASEIREHEERLLAAEARLARFKTENLGYMPGEAGDYHQRLQAALAAVARTEEQIRLMRERRDELQRQIDGEEPVFGIMPATPLGIGGGSCSQSGQIAEAEAQIATLQVQYTRAHPRIRALEERIETLRSQCDAELAEAVASGRMSTGTAPAPSLETNPVYQNLRIQLSSAEVELAQLRAALRTHQDTVAQLRRDVDKIAEVETEFKQLNRDYDVIVDRHQQLLRRWEDLQAKNRLDPITDQVQFRRIEPPFAPAEPVAPNRPLLLVATLVFGLGAGVALAFGLNQVHPVFFTRRKLSRATELPVLGVISMMLSPAAMRQRKLGAFALAGSYAVLVVLTVVLIVLAEPGSALVRQLLKGAAV